MTLATRLWKFSLNLQTQRRKQHLSLLRRTAGHKGNEKRWRQHRVEKHAHMVEKIARQVVPMFARHIPLEDLVQSGYLGLIDAVDRYRYDAAKRGQFERYAYFRIRGSIIDAHERQAYREEQHDSVEAIQERLGFLPGALVRCATPLPDEIAEKSEMERTVALLIAELPEQDVALMRAVMAGASVPEAARALGRSPAWGRARLAAARDRVGAGMILR